jgi:peptide/nickel transport system substrate-binding protein
MPKKDFWFKFPLVLNKKEFFAFWGFFCLFLISIILFSVNFYLSHTVIVPSVGGTLKEGLIGQPRFINPIYAESNDVDRDLTNLIFSGLMRYDQNGVVPDLISNYEIEGGGKVYLVEIRKDVLFHDGVKLTADDIIFTIKTIQNPDFKSPLLSKWLGVEVEKISDYKIKFVLKNPYPGFLENLTLKVLPAHIWKDVTSQNFPLSPYNFKPIGSGPYRFKNLIQDKNGKIKAVILERNNKYYSKKPNISQIKFIFFDKELDLISAAKSGLIDAFSPLSPKNYSAFDSFKKYSFVLPRYFAIFFNSKKNQILEDETVREALSYAIDKEEVKKTALFGEGIVISSPFLPEIYQFDQPEGLINFDPEKAKELFKKAGFEEKDGKLVKVEKEKRMSFTRTLDFGSKGTEVKNLQACLSKFPDIYPEGEVTGYFGSKTKKAVIRFQEKYKDEILIPAGLEKGNGRVGPATRAMLNKVCVISPQKSIPFKIVLTTSNDPLLKEIAQVIKEQWDSLGIETEVQVFEISEIKQEIIKERNYQALLFGQVLGIIPDPFSFWHSSQREYPGLNLANYKNKKLDKLLEKIRIEPDFQKRKELLSEAQEILINDLPAIFLCNPNYIYFSSEKIKGIQPSLIADPSERFSQIQNLSLIIYH